jgi:hypothetical protein
MSNDDFPESIRRTLEARVRHLEPHPDADLLFARVQARTRRKQRLLAGVTACVLVAGVLGGYLLGRSSTSPSSPGVLAPLDDGVPSSPSPISPYAPADVGAANAAIDAAFHAALDGNTTPAAQIVAIQNGSRVQPLMHESALLAQSFGYAPEQLAAAAVAVSDVSFIDSTHAVVHFTLTIPGHGAVLVDRAGYAVFEAGAWRVAMRTACDLVSLNGLVRTCPSAS